MIAAAIDVGTNSLKLVVGETSAEGNVRLLQERVVITRLGEGLQSSGLVAPGAARRTMDALLELVSAARGARVQRICAAATSALREAANAEEFANMASRELGIEFEIISGEREAQLTRKAVELDAALGKLGGEMVTVDVGGGSTEVTTPAGAVSVNVGAVALYERLIKSDPPSDQEMAAARTFACRALADAIQPVPGASVVASGGSAVNLARMAEGIPPGQSAEAHGVPLTRKQIDATVAELSRMTMEQRRAIIGLDPERADIILTGAMILAAALEVLGADRMLVSVRGLRHGLLYEILEASK